MSYAFREGLPPTDLAPYEWKCVPKNARRVIMEQLGEILAGDSPNPLEDQGTLVAALRRAISKGTFKFDVLTNSYLAETLQGYSTLMLQKGQERQGQLLEGAAQALRNIARPRLRR